jgi:ribosome-binding protein aMBF1 (putative translation factor)
MMHAWVSQFKDVCNPRRTGYENLTPSLRAKRNVRRLRQRKSWSQLDLANEAGVRQALISSIEHGHANPTRESLDKVASALDVAVADLLA